VVDMGDDRDVAKIGALLHATSLGCVLAAVLRCGMATGKDRVDGFCGCAPAIAEAAQQRRY